MTREDGGSFNGEKEDGLPERLLIYESRADTEANLLQYIEVFYNRSCRHSTLGYSSPIRFLQDWISKHENQQSKAA